MAVTVTAGDIRTQFPEFGSVADSVIERWIVEATAEVNATQWASRATRGVEWLTAHYLASFASPDCDEPGAGPVSSEREGAVAASYKIADLFARDALGTTKYGRQFLTLRKRVFVKRKI
ncbi:hypothetical protein LCGC14_2158140 [marine sediment metagenome]|uniref:Uncharacterized protein n=1 Tax=marine sediment metagenome TaxID=412755 RepID=A0A0F9G6E4_9ZZZZ